MLNIRSVLAVFPVVGVALSMLLSVSVAKADDRLFIYNPPSIGQIVQHPNACLWTDPPPAYCGFSEAQGLTILPQPFPWAQADFAPFPLAQPERLPVIPRVVDKPNYAADFAPFPLSGAKFYSAGAWKSKGGRWVQP